MDWAAIRHIAHRCGGRLAPENTLEGLELAAARGFLAVEFDVMLSGDGTPVLIHDETLERTTDGRGAVAATGDAELARLYANRGHETRFPVARIPRLDQAIARCRSLGLAMNVELKPACGQDAATGRAVADVLQAEAERSPWGTAPDERPPLLSSFSEEALALASERLPQLPAALLLVEVGSDWAARLRRLGCRSLHFAARQDDWSWLAAARQAGVALRCYTVNDAQQAAALFERGVDAIFTDAVDLFGGATGGNNC